MARLTRPRSKLPLDSLQNGNGKRQKKVPQYTLHSSMQHFFNQKRQDLLDSTPSTYSFHSRVVPDARGELIQPFPAGRPRDVFTDEGAGEQRKRHISKNQQRELDPRWCIARYQLLMMWNADPVKRAHIVEQERATPKMRSLLRKYKLREYDPVEREASACKGTPSMKRMRADDTRKHAESEPPAKKQKLNNAESESCSIVTEPSSGKHVPNLSSAAGTNSPMARTQESTKLRSKQAPEYRRSTSVDKQQDIGEVLQVVQKIREQTRGCDGKENINVSEQGSHQEVERSYDIEQK
ncbi:hypothetical protein LTR10_018945 [Elasticomyces elasticus]|uniref:Uncharacterized protein n=1 Tax=Exophiala sideris TaxID=1016849 RepID=A0ABR0IYH0_9EURO|nr:hypothetical protein LTR10_018945 [Elasticomyces elasticus]KAK5022301.1 hypothetical protein LTS07_010177 [Exophiala sideris]KAK5027113.1 hypothetical protein LTR13_009723 [Exophiala sideris]KAK5051688.1 hypothetical protein LTR69_010188 [Exophiala sideris]KAK5177653.1 hypothetical protein LTR44_009843 [Eurotiomycetes sp. CCFEE 6388]